MPHALTWQEKYLRRQCGLPHLPPSEAPMTPMAPDPDDPATQLLTTAQAAAVAHVDEVRIRGWAHRKQLLPVNEDEDHPLYLRIDVLRVEAKTRRRPRAERLAAEAAAEFGQAA